MTMMECTDNGSHYKRVTHALECLSVALDENVPPSANIRQFMEALDDVKTCPACYVKYKGELKKMKQA